MSAFVRARGLRDDRAMCSRVLSLSSHPVRRHRRMALEARMTTEWPGHRGDEATINLKVAYVRARRHPGAREQDSDRHARESGTGHLRPGILHHPISVRHLATGECCSRAVVVAVVVVVTRHQQQSWSAILLLPRTSFAAADPRANLARQTRSDPQHCQADGNSSSSSRLSGEHTHMYSRHQSKRVVNACRRWIAQPLASSRSPH